MDAAARLQDKDDVGSKGDHVESAGDHLHGTSRVVALFVPVEMERYPELECCRCDDGGGTDVLTAYRVSENLPAKKSAYLLPYHVPPIRRLCINGSVEIGGVVKLQKPGRISNKDRGAVRE
jgi:hypothetical protein